MTLIKDTAVNIVASIITIVGTIFLLWQTPVGTWVYKNLDTEILTDLVSENLSNNRDFTERTAILVRSNLFFQVSCLPFIEDDDSRSQDPCQNNRLFVEESRSRTTVTYRFQLPENMSTCFVTPTSSIYRIRDLVTSVSIESKTIEVRTVVHDPSSFGETSRSSAIQLNCF